ncbi:MAG TPA: Hsp20/alpha crystallin family protein [Candidatus Udaeobacter sp.]|nr:Hsp20/alpha crystallin family protein [Candidatus Udaeobacter sp.]
MPITDLIPWKKTNGGLVQRRTDMDPFSQLHREIDRVFSDFMTDWPWTGRMNLMDRQFGSFVPDVDVTETEKEFRLTAELPGMDEKDLEVTYVDGGLTIKGEKRVEREEQDGDSYRSERQFGAFERTIPLPLDINPDKAKASFKKGVLSITLPKTEEARSNKKTIPIQT